VAQRLEAVRPNRIPPHNVDAEQSVLGAMLESKEAIANVIEIVVAPDFYKPAHLEIYETIMALYGKGEAVDAITVADELARRGKLEAIGGKPYIHGLLEAYPTASSAGHYARIVEELAILRRLIEAGNHVQELGFAMPEDIAETLNEAEEAIFNVGDKRLKDDYHEIRELLMKSMIDIETLYERGAHITGISSGFPDLDDMTAGFQPSNLIIVAARPSMGKSSLMNDFALQAALKGQVPVVIFSLEMSKEEVVKRFLSSEAKVDASRINRGALQEQDWTRLSAALGRLAEAPVFIDDSANITLMEIRAKCRRLKAKHGLGLVVVDYLQLMQSPRRSENRVQEVSEISRSLKILARELQVPVVCASQLNRGVEMRSDKRPLLGDLRESGCLTGETLVTLASGKRRPIAALVGTNPDVMTVEGWHFSARTASKVWKLGSRPVFKLRTGTGREIRATEAHPFLMLDGWMPVGNLKPGDRIAIPRRLPVVSFAEWDPDRLVLLAHLIGDGCFASRQPLHYTSKSEANLVAVQEAASRAFGVTGRRVRHETWTHLYLSADANKWHPNPIREWLRDLGLDGFRSHQKFVPEAIFGLTTAQIRLFLKHLWVTDGCVWTAKEGSKGPAARIYYASNSRSLAVDVQELLVRLGIRSRIKEVRKGTHRPGYQVVISGKFDLVRFVELIGGYGHQERTIEEVDRLLASIESNTNLDSIPVAIWDRVRFGMKQRGISQRRMAELRGTAYGGTSHFRFAPSRETLAGYASILDDPELKEIAASDLFWDSVVSVEPDGVEDVYDMTVPETHNFVANGVVVKNSIEQDSDIVMFIYRDEVYNPDTEAKGEAELIVAKHRNGPTGKVRLAFMNQYTKFASIARGTP